MNNNINLAGKKKKTRRKKKSFPPKPQQPLLPTPAATLQGLRTIASLIQIHQQFNLTRPKLLPSYFSSQEPRPLMSGPRIPKPMFSGLNMTRFETPRPNVLHSTTNTESSDKNEPSTSKINETVTHDNLKSNSQNTKNGQQQSDDSNPENQQTDVQSSGNNDVQNNSKNDSIQAESEATPTSNKNIPQQYKNMKQSQFDEFEIYNSPSFMSFETEEELDETNVENAVNQFPDHKNTPGNVKIKELKQSISLNIKRLQQKMNLESNNSHGSENSKDSKQMTGQGTRVRETHNLSRNVLS